MWQTDDGRHMKAVDVPQIREWQQVRPMEYALVWEDGYDALAYVQCVSVPYWHWWTTKPPHLSGFAATIEDAFKQVHEAIERIYPVKSPKWSDR
jgi:hypothetical protein